MKIRKNVVHIVMRYLSRNPQLTISVFSLIVLVKLIHAATQLATLPGGLIVVVSTTASVLVFIGWLVCQFRPIR